MNSQPMTMYQIAHITVLTLSLVLSITALVLSVLANKKTNRQAKTAALNNIFVNIGTARGRMEDHVAQMASLSGRNDLTGC